MSLQANLQAIHERVANAIHRVGRQESDVQLLLATKNVTADVVRCAYGYGERLFGENRVQEALPKIASLSDLRAEWHFIGSLQTNKVSIIAPHVNCIQSVDRDSLVKELGKRLLPTRIMVEVNTSDEDTKNGVGVDGVWQLLDTISTYSALRVIGFMTIASLSNDERTVRGNFSLLRQLRDEAIDRGQVGVDCIHLSMGMSADLEWAIAEGATIIRVGSAVFGERVR